ncbi:MAG TPA: FAD-dependent oxidoreductase, partial [Thermoleophilaceae bacterium]|nr:FAD-dependent oxidoreductase [Thermoleophilaceae bacterium]
VRFVEPRLPFAAADLVIGRGGKGLGGEVERMLSEASAAILPLLYRPPAAAPALALADVTPSVLAQSVGDPRAGVVLRYACGLAGFLDGDVPLGPIGAFAVARLFSPSIVVGGTKNLANGLFRVAARAGARGFVSAEVVRVERDGEGFLLRLADSREIRSRAVISTLDLRSTFLGLLDDELVSAELRGAAEGWIVEGTGPFTAHFGIKGEPPPPAGGEYDDALIRIFGFAEQADVERHFRAALEGRLPASVAGHLTAVTAHDPLQASPGPYGPLHTLRVQTVVPFEPADGSWDGLRTANRRECWDAVAAHFAGLDDARLLFQFCDTPLDIERRFGTTRRGSIRQGALVAGQTLVDRPHSSCSTGRTPVGGVYLGGGALHPGVPGSLGGGYNAAAVLAEDLGLPFSTCT